MIEKNFVKMRTVRNRQTLLDIVPDIIRYWDYEKNGGLRPEDIPKGSQKKIYMSCPICGKDMLRVVNNIWKLGEDGNPYITPCHACAILIGGRKKATAAVAVCPEVREWWDFEKNEGIDLEQVAHAANKKMHFKCPVCGEGMYREMNRFLVKQKDGSFKPPVCQKCTPTIPKNRIVLTDAVPDIEKYWDFEKNGGKSPSEFSRAASDKVWTYCPICGTSVRRNVRYTWEPDENGVGHVIHCRTCGKHTRANSLVEHCPDITKYWDYGKNEHNPEYYTVSSGKKVYVRCPRCGRSLLRPVCDTVQKQPDGSVRISYCLPCSREEVLEKRRCGQNNIAKCCPDIDKYWDFEANAKQPGEFTRTSSEKIYTHCPSCGKLMLRMVCNTFVKKGDTWTVSRCQKCAALESSREMALLRNGPLNECCPEIEEWWDYEKNDLTPDRITRGTHYEAYVKCPACHSSFLRDMHSFIGLHKDGRYLPVECPECGYSSKGDPKDNLVAVCPDIVNWWNYKKNSPFKPEQFTKGASFQAYLTCPECGMELHSGIHSLLATGEDGTISIAHNGKCRKIKAHRSSNNLLKNYPNIVHWWDYEKNYPDVPEDYTLFSPKQAYFRCPDCGSSTFRRIVDAFVTDEKGVPLLFNCPYCSGVRPIRGVNSLAALYPDIASECISTDDTERISPASLSRMEWKCKACGSTWFDIVSNRVNGAGCPFCTEKRVLAGYNDLKTTDPELADEWSPNNMRGPETVLKNNRIVVRWICPTCQGEYSAFVADREVGDEACPYCRGIRVLKGVNSFEARHPDLMEEWLELENLLAGNDPDLMLEISVTEAWWRCNICGTKYTMSIKDRLMKQKRNHNPCPKCNGRRQKKIHFV